MSDGEKFLAHYGIKGMRWGVRKKEAQKQADIYRQGIAKRASERQGPISSKEYAQLSTQKQTLAKKGDTLYRVSGEKKESLRGKTYVTSNIRDNDVYVALLAAKGKNELKKYQMTLKVHEDLVSPSKRERVDTFIETLDKDIYVPQLRRTVKGRDFLATDAISRAQSSKELGLKFYNQFVQSQVMNTPLHSAYFESIKSRGYNALFDDADANIVTTMPAIVFDPEYRISTVSTTRLNEVDVVEARERLNR